MMEKNIYMSVLLDTYGNMLTRRQYEVIDAHYNRDLSLAEIAEWLGGSRQSISDALKKGCTALIEWERKLGFAARQRDWTTRTELAIKDLDDGKTEDARRKLRDLIGLMEE